MHDCFSVHSQVTMMRWLRSVLSRTRNKQIVNVWRTVIYSWAWNWWAAFWCWRWRVMRLHYKQSENRQTYSFQFSDIYDKVTSLWNCLLLTALLLNTWRCSYMNTCIMYASFAISSPVSHLWTTAYWSSLHHAIRIYVRSTNIEIEAKIVLKIMESDIFMIITCWRHLQHSHHALHHSSSFFSSGGPSATPKSWEPAQYVLIYLRCSPRHLCSADLKTNKLFLSQALLCIAHFISGFKKGQERLVMSGLGWLKGIPALRQILKICLYSQDPSEHAAARSVIWAFCAENPDGQSMLAATLIPSTDQDSGTTWFASSASALSNWHPIAQK